VGFIAFAVMFMFATGAYIFFLPLIAVAVVLIVIAERLRNQIETAETFHESSFTPKLVDEIPDRPNFVLTEFNQPMSSSVPHHSDSVEAANFRVALRDAFNVHQNPPPIAPPREELNIEITAQKLKASLNPSVAIPKRAEFVLRIPAKIKDSYLRPHKT